jgi:hypothetical protein
MPWGISLPSSSGMVIVIRAQDETADQREKAILDDSSHQSQLTRQSGHWFSS